MRKGGDQRVLATVLFTDIVRSTDIAVELGDVRWKELLRRHHAIVRRELRRFGGREVDTAGDGFFATFDTPAHAVRCANACVEGVRQLGIEIRAGLHTGEVEFQDGKARGIAVHLGARVMSKAASGDVVVTGTVRDVVAGAGLEFDDRGAHELKGVPGEWRLWQLSSIDGEPTTAPLGEAEAAARRASIEAPRAARRRALLVGGLAGLAVVGALVALLLAGGGHDVAGPTGPPAPTGPQPGDVIEFDPATGEVLKSEAVGVVPSRTKGISIARGQGSVWVDSREDTTLTPIDEETGVPGDETPIGFAGQGIFVEGPYVWVAGEHGLVKVSPATGDAETAFEVASTGELPAAAGDGSVWVFAEGDIVRLNATTGKVQDRAKVSGDVSGLAYGDGTLWAIDKLNSDLIKIDPRTGKVDARRGLPGNLDAVIVGEGYAWVIDETAGTITPVDAETGEVKAPLRVGDTPAGAAVGLGSVWVGDLAAAELWRIDPLALQAHRVAAPASVAAIVEDEGDHSLWLALSRERTATEF